MPRNYRSFEKPVFKYEEKKPHPIWRGIGWIFMFLIPALAYFGGMELIRLNFQNHWFPVPEELAGPEIYPYLFLKILVVLVLMILIYLVFLIITFVINAIAGPGQLGPFDSPALHYRGKRRR